MFDSGVRSASRRWLSVVAFGAAAHAASAQTAQYTITDAGDIAGYDYLIFNNGGSRILNNAGQFIAQAVKVIEFGDLPNLVPPNVEYIAVRYTPGVGLERLAPALTQNFVMPWQINEVGGVFGRAIHSVRYFNDAGALTSTETQHEIWRTTPNGTLELFNVPPDVRVNAGQAVNRYRFNSSGSALIFTRVPQTFNFGGGAYLADGWHAQSDFFVPPPGLTTMIAAINDSGVIIGSTTGSDTVGWMYQPGVGASLVDASHLGLFATPRIISNEGHIVGNVTVATPPGSPNPYVTHTYAKRAGQPAVDTHHPSFGAETQGTLASWPYVAGGCLDASRTPIGTFRWNADTGASDFIPNDPFEFLGGLQAVNTKGVIIGLAVTDVFPRSPWVARSGPTREYLRDLIDDPFELTWRLTQAVDINDRGQILVTAFRVSDNSSRALILTPRCVADFNSSGASTIDDIFIFLNAWFASDPRADINGQDGVTIDDIFIFLNAWFAGCP